MLQSRHSWMSVQCLRSTLSWRRVPSENHIIFAAFDVCSHLEILSWCCDGMEEDQDTSCLGLFQADFELLHVVDTQCRPGPWWPGSRELIPAMGSCGVCA